MGFRWGLLLIAAIGATGCQDRVVNLRPFVGTWLWDDSGKIVASCAALPDPLVGSTAGVSFAIRPGTSTDLQLEIGCYCSVDMNINGLEATAAGKQPACRQFVDGRAYDDRIDTFRLAIDRDSNGDETISALSTGSSSFVVAGFVISCSSFTITGKPTRSPDAAVACGSDDTAVGVIPFSSGDPKFDCPGGAGHDGVALTIDNENSASHAFCTHDTGALGEGLWALPDAVKYPPPPCAGPRIDSYLPFCRVDGALFKAMTADKGRKEEGYAVLKLGDHCPSGSVEMTKVIQTDDAASPTSNNANSWGGHPSKSQEVRAGLNSFVKMAFCYFTAASRADDVMNDFPDLGFSYSVFHDFDGPQPSWVISKRWHYSDDNDSAADSYIPADPGDFETIIENTNGDTVFDMARVR